MLQQEAVAEVVEVEVAVLLQAAVGVTEVMEVKWLVLVLAAIGEVVVEVVEAAVKKEMKPQEVVPKL